jgi:hypothetical protein
MLIPGEPQGKLDVRLFPQALILKDDQNYKAGASKGLTDYPVSFIMRLFEPIAAGLVFRFEPIRSSPLSQQAPENLYGRTSRLYGRNLNLYRRSFDS